MKKSAMLLVVSLGLISGPFSPAADFNGDGKDDVAIFRESTGLWVVRGFTRAYFGGRLDIPVPGDYYGGSEDEICIFRPSTGLWAVRNWSRIYFGADGDVPLGQSGLKQNTNFFFDPNKHAFRAGIAEGGQWNDQSVGTCSIALGFNPTASGPYSTALGSYTKAGGWHSTALGNNISVTGDNSFGFGTYYSSSAVVSDAAVFVIHGAYVGIGETDPQVELEVYDREGELDNDVKLRLASRGSNNDAVIEFYEDAAAAMSIHYDGGSSPNKLVIKDLTSSTDLVTFERSGNVGIGTDDPTCRLMAADTVDDDGLAYILNLSSNSNADALAIKINRSTPGASNSFVSCHKANGAMIGGIIGNGSGGVEFWSSGSDFAEFLPRLRAGEGIQAGDVVGVFGGKISKVTREADQVQVISTAPIVSGNAPPAGEERLYEKVAFLGRAPVKVRGSVRLGDYIVPSGLNDGTGVAVSPREMTPAQAAQVVGRAWEASEKEEVKPIEAAVGLQSSAAALREISREKDCQIARIQERLSLLEDKLAKLEGR